MSEKQNGNTGSPYDQNPAHEGRDGVVHTTVSGKLNGKHTGSPYDQNLAHEGGMAWFMNSGLPKQVRVDEPEY